MSPYHGTQFFTFFAVLAQRLWSWLSGASLTLASDELQLLVLALLAISGSLVGTFLVYRRMAMLANSLSHTMLLGIVIAYLTVHRSLLGEINLPVMLIAALATGGVTTFLTETLTKTVRLQADAANGLVSSSLLALGILLLTVGARNAHVGTEVVVGNVDALHPADLRLAMWMTVGNLALIGVFYRAYFVTTFDAGFARSIRISPLLFNYLLMMQTSVTAIGGFRAVGIVMVLAFIVAPPLIARVLTDSLRRLLVYSCLIGIAATLVGVGLARHFLSAYQLPLSTAGLVVCCLTLFYPAAWAIRAIRIRWLRSAAPSPPNVAQKLGGDSPEREPST